MAKLESTSWALFRDLRCVERDYILSNVRAVNCRNTYTVQKATGRHKNSSLATPKLLWSILSSVEVRPVSNSVKHTQHQRVGAKLSRAGGPSSRGAATELPPHPCMGGLPAQCLPIALPTIPLLTTPQVGSARSGGGGDMVSQACHTH